MIAAQHDVGREGHLRAGTEREVAADRCEIGKVVEEHSFLVGLARGEHEIVSLRASTRGQEQPRKSPCAQRATIGHRSEGDHIAERLAGEARPYLRIREALGGRNREVRRPQRLGPVRASGIESRFPGRATRSALLREDLHHARCGLGAVQRGGRRSADHLDEVDVLRIDGIERRRRLAEHIVVSLVARAHPHAVHVDRGAVPRPERSGAAQAEAGAGSHGAGRLQERQSRSLGLKHLRKCDHGRLSHHLARIHHDQGVAHRAPTPVSRDSGDDDRIKRDAARGHRQVHRGRSAGDEREDSGRGCVAESAREQLAGAGRHVRQSEAAGGVHDCSDSRIAHPHLRRDDGRTSLRVDHASDHGTRLRPRGIRAEQDHQGAQELGSRTSTTWSHSTTVLEGAASAAHSTSGAPPSPRTFRR